MKTLAESISEYNEGKLKLDTSFKTLKKEAIGTVVLLKDVKDALMKVYRQKGLDIANDILAYFNVKVVEDLNEGSFTLFLEMCAKEIVNQT